MRGIRYVGVALVATVALGSATAAGASAHTFTASKTGEIKAKQLTSQIFATAAGNIECETLTGTGAVSALTEEVQKATVKYGGCFAFGIATTISPIEFEFNANGTASILKQVTVKASAFCTITIPAQSKLSTVTYVNLTGGKIELEPEIDGITSTGTGDACAYGTESKGQYEGRTEVELVGGTLTWA